jgi:hypothetical protein
MSAAQLSEEQQQELEPPNSVIPSLSLFYLNNNWD